MRENMHHRSKELLLVTVKHHITSHDIMEERKLLSSTAQMRVSCPPVLLAGLLPGGRA